MQRLTAPQFAAVLEQLKLAVFVFASEGRLRFYNKSARQLRERVRRQYGVEFLVMLQDHIAGLTEQPPRGDGFASLITAGKDAEPFYVDVMRLRTPRADTLIVLTVREVGAEREAFRERYGLSEREAQIVELVLRGYTNRDVAHALGIAATTTKKHLTRIFDKIGVDTRAQLISRLA